MVIRADVSSAVAFLNRMPRRAPSPVPTMIAVGVARPRASGQVMTTTVMANSSAVDAGAFASRNQTENVTAPPSSATATSQDAARSASRWPGALLFCASWTSATMCASAVSAPTLVARIRRAPAVLIVAPVTSEPGCLWTGRLSPVTIDSSTSDSPFSTTPSTAIVEPGRTTSRSPVTTSAVRTSIGPPSRMTVAVSGASSSRVWIASLAPLRARISNQCPRSTKAARSAAAS